MERCWLRRSVSGVLLLFLLLFPAGCADKQPIKIGFVGNLTGRVSDIGEGGRNGSMLAIEEVNQQGGIGGRTLEILVRDDKNEPSVAQQVDIDLIEQGVALIIGHMTSRASVAGAEIANQRGVLMISPTARTSELAGRDDMFFSVITPLNLAARAQAEYALQRKNLRTMVAVYDSSNREFAEDWITNFQGRYEALGGQMLKSLTFASSGKVEYISIAKQVKEVGAEGILLAAGAVDAAMLCQQLAKHGVDVPIFSSSWAMTDDFIQTGGALAEGVLFSNINSGEEQFVAYQAFAEAYRKRFGKEPTYAAAYGYQATRVALQALQRNSDVRVLKKTLLNSGDFEGLWGAVRFDKFGNVLSENHIIIVRNGIFRNEE